MKRTSAKRHIALVAAFVLVGFGTSIGSHMALGRHAEETADLIDVYAAMTPGTDITVKSLVVETKAGVTQKAEVPRSKPEPASLISKPVYARNFNDLAELQRWLDEQKNVVTLYFQYPGDKVDCDDYASALQRAGLEDGYLVSFQIIDADKYNSLFKNSLIPVGSIHALNLAIAGNGAYLIEPQTGEVVFTAHID